MIIWKLKNLCNISDPIVKWIYEFLKNRTQRIKIWGTVSNWRKTKSGGPQGSVLLPLLFIMFSSDIPIDTEIDQEKCRGAGFVDDIVIYGTGEVHDQIKNLNERLLNIYDWSNKWGIDFNVEKCKSITFTKKNRLVQYDRRLYMGGVIFKKVHYYKYLGIFLSSNMLFDHHVEYFLKRIKKESYLLKNICKKSRVGKRMFGNIFWNVKLRPMIEYGVVIWSTCLSERKFHEVQKCQIDFFREIHRYGKTSCITAMMMDLSIVDIGIRIGVIKEKFSLKCMIRKVPRRISRYCETKDQLPHYSTQISRDGLLPNGYVNVESHDGRTKYKSTVRFTGRKKPIHFYSNYAREAEKQRITWINKNMKTWYGHHKSPQTVFTFDKFYREIKSSKVIDPNEVEEWKDVVDGDKHKLWNYIRKICKIRTKIKQENLWNESNVGTILKQFKTKWYNDKLINNVENDKVHLLKKLRIGNSKLRRHSKPGLLKVCINCDVNKVETIQHYILECKKYEVQRNMMINSVRGPLEEMGYNITTKILLGFFEEIFLSKDKTEKYYKNMCAVIDAVILFIIQTERFN